MKAEDDLPWYWGSGPKTAEGDCGLRSPLGGMLAKVRDGVSGGSLREDDDDSERLFAAGRMRRIKARLEGLSPDAVTHLWCHYVQKPLPFNISACAIFTRGASTLMGDDCPDPAKLAKRMREMKAQDKRIVGLEAEANALLNSAVAAYEARAASEAKRDRRDPESRAAAEAGMSESAHLLAMGPEAVLDAIDERSALEKRLAECDKLLERMAAAERAVAQTD